MAANELKVRAALPGDHEWIVSAHGDVYASEFGFDRGFQDGIAGKMQAFRRLPSTFNRIWVGIIGDERVASIAVSERPAGVAFLNFVLVLPQHRGKGAGLLMMQTALNHARAHGLKEVQLETYSCLIAARALYRRLGFEPVTVVPDQAAYGQAFDQEFWTLSI